VAPARGTRPFNKGFFMSESRSPEELLRELSEHLARTLVAADRHLQQLSERGDQVNDKLQSAIGVTAERLRADLSEDLGTLVERTYLAGYKDAGQWKDQAEAGTRRLAEKIDALVARADKSLRAPSPGPTSAAALPPLARPEPPAGQPGSAPAPREAPGALGPTVRLDGSALGGARAPGRTVLLGFVAGAVVGALAVRSFWSQPPAPLAAPVHCPSVPETSTGAPIPPEPVAPEPAAPSAVGPAAPADKPSLAPQPALRPPAAGTSHGPSRPHSNQKHP
jgi:hypothetical protein